MRRNPLLRRFQTLFADFEEAERTGRPVAEIRDERRHTGLSRRDFLKVGGVAVGAAALAPSAALAAVGRGAASQGRIAIVGGGIAGLTAALTLQDKGVYSDVYESSGRDEPPEVPGLELRSSRRYGAARLTLFER